MEDFVPFLLAKKLEEKGYPQDIQHCIGWYPTEYYKNSCIGEYFEGELQEIEDYFGDRISAIHIMENEKKGVIAPTISQVLKWLREEKKIDAGATWDNSECKWIAYASEMNMPDLVGLYTMHTYYNFWEEASLAIIEYVIDNLI